MTASPGQLLMALVGQAADAALASSTLAGRGIDRTAFIAANHAALLTLLASQPTLRAQLAAKYADQLASVQCRHALLDDLLSADAETAAAAAKRLGADRAALTRPPDRARAPGPARADGEVRRVSQLQRRLEHARARRDQAWGQLEYAQAGVARHEGRAGRGSL